MKQIALLFLLCFTSNLLAPSVLAQNPVSGGPIPQSTYNTPPVLANPTHGTGAPTGTCMSGVLYTNDSNGNLYSCNAGTWGLASGAGSVTHTAGNLTLNSMMLGNGVADAKVDSACVTNGTGALSGCTSISAGSGASSAGATATGGFACVEAASTGWTPTAGQDYIRCDSTLHNFVSSVNGVAESLIGNVTGQTNVYGAFLQDFTAATMELPEAAGFTTNVNSTIGLDTTANTCKVWVNSADAICAVEATAIAAGFMPKSTDATHGLLTASLCDEGITAANTLTCTDTAGLAIPKIGTGAAPPACAVATSAWCGVESVAPTLVAGVSDIYPNSTNHCEDVANGLAENGCIVGSTQTIVTIGSGADIAATSLCSTVNCPAGTYRVDVYIDMTTPCGTTGTFIAWLGYTDDSSARTGSSTTTFFDIQGTGSVPATGTLTTTSTANYGQATYILRTTGAATGGLGSINYGATRTACGSAGPMVGKMYLTVERIGFL